MNIREVKDFSFHDIEGTADGLSLKILKGLCDELSFQNLGRDGWELVIHFRLKNFKRILADAENSNLKSTSGVSSDFTIRQTAYDDIPGVIDLVYNTYRYTYNSSFAYDQKLFQEEIDSGRLFSLVVVTPDGKIVGHQAVIFQKPNIGEIGMAMVDPQYRRSRAFILLKNATFDEIKLRFSSCIIFGKTVTSHKASQAFMSGFTISMLVLSYTNSLSFVGIDTKQKLREGAVYGFRTFSDQKVELQIFVPTEHLNMIGLMLQDSCFSVLLQKNDADFENELSVFEVVKSEYHYHAFLNFEKVGADFDAQLRKQTRLLQLEEMVTLYVSIPTNENQPKSIDRILMDNGYFFSGVQANSEGGLDMYYTNLLNQKFSFDDLQLFSPKSVELKNYMEALYRQIVDC